MLSSVEVQVFDWKIDGYLLGLGLGRDRLRRSDKFLP